MCGTIDKAWLAMWPSWPCLINHQVREPQAFERHESNGISETIYCLGGGRKRLVALRLAFIVVRHAPDLRSVSAGYPFDGISTTK